MWRNHIICQSTFLIQFTRVIRAREDSAVKKNQKLAVSQVLPHCFPLYSWTRPISWLELYSGNWEVPCQRWSHELHHGWAGWQGLWCSVETLKETFTQVCIQVSQLESQLQSLKAKLNQVESGIARKVDNFNCIRRSNLRLFGILES